MIAESIARMLVFPYRIQDAVSGDLIYESSASMFACPSYTRASQDFFTKIKNQGWSKCPAGYAVYARKFPGDDRKLIVVHGLKVNGFSTHQGRDAGLTIKIDQSKLVEHVDAFIAAVAEANELVQSSLTASIHEIRSVNAALYHCAVELQAKLSNQGPIESLSRNTTALSELLSSRITLIDAMASESVISGVERKPIAMYKKFDKMHRCFQAYSKARKIDLKMMGGSHLEVFGDDLTELIPLLLIDNAVKYSPDKAVVSIDVRDNGQRVCCSVKSRGPKLEKGEEDFIFLRGYRGERARALGTSGSGIGLYFLRLLVSAHSGTVSVSQDTVEYLVKTNVYYDTTFSLEFPAWGSILAKA